MILPMRDYFYDDLPSAILLFATKHKLKGTKIYMKTIICTLGFLAAPTSFASQQIRIDTVKYSGSANIHFNALQAEIAIEAVNLCGS